MAPENSYAELEMALHRVDASHYHVELRFSDPSSEADVPPERAPASFDLEELLALHHDAESYGKLLTDNLFADESVRGLYGRARAVTESKGHLLRIRLLITASALELQALRWELLHDPESGLPIATSERTLFSRFMLSRDWRPVKLRAKSQLRALVAVAAPSNLAKYKLAEVDAKGEVERAERGLQGVSVAVAGLNEPLTLDSLAAGLRDGVDILYLVCHGVLTRRQKPLLLLQDDRGEVARVAGELLATTIAELALPPRLVVLASCESAGTEAGTTADGRATAEASLAPRLAEAGVPAVLAMQGQISMETVEKAMPVFFTELLKDGQIDRAMAVARSTVRGHDDSWMPALYLRLKRGRIWYVPGFGGEEADFSKWRSLVGSVRQGRFVPLVGADVGEHVFGAGRDLAGELGKQHGFPMAAHHLGHLPKVAQYLSIDESRKYARDAVLHLMHKQVSERFPEIAEEGLSLPKLLDGVVEKQEESDPFRILASLPGAVYIAAGADPLMLKSLKSVGKTPKPLLCNWRPTADNHPREPVYEDEPSPDQPIVYHVFGVLGKPDSLVLTEDDFFDHLIATSEYKLIPTAVRGALTRSSLLFLGFHLNELSFRCLFRLIMTLGGVHKLREYAHVGVQVDPEEHDLSDLEGARQYLADYFGAGTGGPPISIYWGTPTDFLKELQQQMQQADQHEPVSVVLRLSSNRGALISVQSC